LNILENLIVPLNLGHDTFSRNSISFQKVMVLNKALANFRDIAKEYRVNKIKVFATAALREAINKDYIIYQIQNKNSFEVKIYEDIEEHKVIYHGIKNSEKYRGNLKDSDGLNLFSYIGTGSLGVALVDKIITISSQSMRLGSLKISEILKGIQHKTVNFHTVVDGYLSGYLYNLNLYLKEHDINNFYAAGKEIELIARLSGKKEVDKYFPISRAAFYRLYNQIKSKTPKQLMDKYDLEEIEAEILLPSMTIYKSLMNLIKIDEIIGTDVNIEEENLKLLLFDDFQSEMEQQSYNNIIASCRSVGRKYNYNEPHSAHIEKIALLIFNSLQNKFELTSHEKMLLQASAILHDIGKYINHKVHYEHSYYLIKNSDITDLCSHDKEIIAHIALNHSQNVKKNINLKYDSLNNQKDRLQIAKITALLKIADSLDKSHLEPFSEIEAELNDDKLTITVLTEKEIFLEQWAFQSKSRIFRDIFGIDVELNKKSKFI